MEIGRKACIFYLLTSGQKLRRLNNSHKNLNIDSMQIPSVHTIPKISEKTFLIDTNRSPHF